MPAGSAGSKAETVGGKGCADPRNREQIGVGGVQRTCSSVAIKNRPEVSRLSGDESFITETSAPATSRIFYCHALLSP